MQLMLFPKRNNCINVTGCISISIAIINRSVIIIVIIIIVIIIIIIIITIVITFIQYMKQVILKLTPFSEK